jgi:hypothetical protein
MGNKRARAFRLQQQDAANWANARSAQRSASDDVFARGIGVRRLQLIECPSFSDSRAWEVRQRDSEWWLFGSWVVEPWPAVELVGYEPLDADPAVLAEFFRRVTGLSLPIAPDLSDMGGLDGTVIQLAVFGDNFSECRFQWWSQPPDHWKPLTDLAVEMIATFATAENMEFDPNAAPGGNL